MAEQIPYGVATSLINTLASLAFKEVALIYGIKSEIDWVKNTVEAIKAVLSDADKKQQNNQLIQLWIRDLKQVLYDADDLLDELHSQHLLRNRDAKDNKGKGKVREFFSSSNPIVSRHKIARQIRKIKEQFNAVAETMSKLNLDPRVVVELKHEKSNWRETSSKHEENIIGREESEKEITDLLLNANNNENVSLVAIVGIGGLGKTALAQLVYNNAQVNNYFDKKMWVCVSEEFDVKPLVKKILESSIRKEVNDQQLELLQDKLEDNLNSQRYLLVLDDVWNEDREKWLHLKKYLICGAQGSKILLTTRNQMVANKMGVKTSYFLKGLANDQSWTLLRNLAVDEDKRMTQKLESIGRKIAEKCAGVPLAVRVMGSLLQSKSRENDWEAVLEGQYWQSCEGNDNSIMPILKLSYDNLAIELKQCFAYCSLYPKDWRYRKDELIDLWMAHGFLENEDEKQCLEDVGEEYVRILLMKSFLQDVERDALGEIKYFKMHDLMHDLSQLIAGSNYCLYVDGRKNVVGHPIHASFVEYNSESLLNTLDPSRLRAILDIKEKHGSPLDLSGFKRLRSLNLSHHIMSDLPESIGKMTHLRYLDLSSSCFLTYLPKSIGNLVNLQSLRLDGCLSLEFSLDVITKLINLRRLDIKNCKAFNDGMPIGLGRMTTIEHLSEFIVGNDDKKRRKAKLNELKDLNLRGSLTIRELNFVRDVEEESRDVNLRTKKNLISLSLEWGVNENMKSNDAMQLLENLHPHQDLKALEITEYPGVRLSDWLLSCTNIVHLKFSRIRNCRYLVALEGLVSLKTLYIESMDKLEHIYYKGCSSPTYFFASLEELRIQWCEMLTGWVREENVQNTRNNEWHHSLPSFSRLSLLQIYHCPELTCMPIYPNLMRHLGLTFCSTKPLLDTLNVSAIGPSTSDDKAASLSMLKSLHIEGIDIEALPEEWMQNLSSLEHLYVTRFSSLEEPFRHMRNLSATLEKFTIGYIDSWRGDENYSIQCQNLCCLNSLQKIRFIACDHLVALPEWICDLHSLRFIEVQSCDSLESFPKGMSRLTNLQTLRVEGAYRPLKERCQREIGAEWPKIAHIPDIWINRHQI